jgi:hypothetical protein
MPSLSLPRPLGQTRNPPDSGSRVFSSRPTRSVTRGGHCGRSPSSSTSPTARCGSSRADASNSSATPNGHRRGCDSSNPPWEFSFRTACWSLCIWCSDWPTTAACEISAGSCDWRDSTNSCPAPAGTVCAATRRRHVAAVSGRAAGRLVHHHVSGRQRRSQDADRVGRRLP